MAATCTVCRHPERNAIDQALVSGVSQYELADQHGLGRTALTRHKAGHISKAIKAVIERRGERATVKLVDRVDSMVGRIEAVVEKAEARGGKDFLAGARELHRWLELYGKLTGELDTRPTMQVINVSTSPQWHALRAILDELLDDEQKAELVQRLAALHGQQAQLEAHSA